LFERDEVTGDWKKLHSGELDYLYFIPSTIQVIKSRRIRMAWHVTYNGERRGAYSVWWVNLMKIDNLEDGIDGRIILKWLLKKFVGRAWT